MLDELIERHGAGAEVTAYPVMLDSGVTYRWEILIDGEHVSDVSVHAHGIRGRPNEVVLMMVHGNDEIERSLLRWSALSPSASCGRWGSCGANVMRD